MKTKSRKRYKNALSVAAIALWVVAGTAISHAQLSSFIEAGKESFTRYCAACHGTDAKGTGPLAALLKKGAPDLTLISKKNNGMFAFLKTVEIVAGDRDVAAHGGREMPVWGEAFRTDGDAGGTPSRILDIVLYLNSIQAK